MPKTPAACTGRPLAIVRTMIFAAFALCATAACQQQSPRGGGSGSWSGDRTAAGSAAGTAAPRATSTGAGASSAGAPGAAPTFRQAIDHVMPHMGAGNWIVIADSSFPKSSHPGWKTVPMDVSPTDALGDVIASARAYGHVKPVIWLDRELFVISDAHVPGITEFRETVEMQSSNLLMDASVLQADRLKRLREVGQHHRVLVIKTPGRLPYSSIYVEFVPEHWTPQQEAALRAHMATNP